MHVGGAGCVWGSPGGCGCGSGTERQGTNSCLQSWSCLGVGWAGSSIAIVIACVLALLALLALLA